jgi:diaminopimelate decarboxylase
MNPKDYKRIADQFGTPIYIYEAGTIKENFSEILPLITYPGNKVYYAVMCNNQPKILKIINDLGLGVQVNSEYELNSVKKAGFNSSDISFTSAGINKELMKKLIDERIEINLDSVEEIKKFCGLINGRTFGIRVRIPESIILDSKDVTNKFSDSNIGIEEKDFDLIKEIAKNTGNKITGVHGYLASNIHDIRPFMEFGDYLIKVASEYRDLEYVNFSSGFGVKYSETDKDFDLKGVLHYYSSLMVSLSGRFKREIILKIEPGRILMADAGSLLARITNIKTLGPDKSEISIDAGFAEFARPKIYNSYHEIENLEITGKPKMVYDIRGNTVLQNDFLGQDRTLEEVTEGDLLLIKKTGAYGFVMASGFPGKKLPRQILIQKDKIEEL